MGFLKSLFGGSKPKKLADYPLKTAKHHGKTFDQWRIENGYSLEKGSVPDSNLTNYCSDCGWPTKDDWKQIRNLQEWSKIPDMEYAMWLMFIGVIPKKS